MLNTRVATALGLTLTLMLAAPARPAAVPLQIQMTPGEMPFQMLPPGRQAKTGTGRLRGRVQAADTGAVVRRGPGGASTPRTGTKPTPAPPPRPNEPTELPARRLNPTGLG